uniref:Putative LOV domain-containing protein n=1 Tax=Mallomonas sp. BC-2016 TaxID=1802913 RepID=A0A126WWD0_9STRA|nr:putative LOV domain-containing protein [Mallomonas sp. BC-2016]
MFQSLPPVFSCVDENLFDVSDFGLISDYLVNQPPVNGKRQRLDGATENEDKVSKKAKEVDIARKSRLRKKLFFEALQRQMAQLAKEGEFLRDVIKKKVPSDLRVQIFEKLAVEPQRLVTCTPADATSFLGRSDFHLMTSIQTAQRSFIITNPSIPDNPIVFASDGFLALTGYKRGQVMGRNCRFLGGPGTDQKKINELSRAISAGHDCSVCLLNYRSDGSTFLNQLFVAALRNKDNEIVNYVGVQVEVSDIDAAIIDHRPEDNTNTR